MSEDEFRINEPELKKSKEKEIADKLKKAKAVEFAMLCTILSKKDDLDADNLYQIYKGDVKVCCLTYTLPCKNPHCSTCNIPLMNGREAEKIAEGVGKRYGGVLVKRTLQEMGDELTDKIDEFIESLKIKEE